MDVEGQVPDDRGVHRTELQQGLPVWKAGHQDRGSLARALNNDNLAHRFLSDYLGLLQHRLQRIAAAVENYDDEAAMDAILSLKIASSMVSAHDAASRCASLQSLVAAGRFDQARSEVNELSTSISELTMGAGAFLASLQTDPV